MVTHLFVFPTRPQKPINRFHSHIKPRNQVEEQRSGFLHHLPNIHRRRRSFQDLSASSKHSCSLPSVSFAWQEFPNVILAKVWKGSRYRSHSVFTFKKINTIVKLKDSFPLSDVIIAIFDDSIEFMKRKSRVVQIVDHRVAWSSLERFIADLRVLPFLLGSHEKPRYDFIDLWRGETFVLFGSNGSLVSSRLHSA